MTPILDFPGEIARVEKHIREAVRVNGGLLGAVAEYVGLGGGKKLRPRLLILAARAVAPSQLLRAEIDEAVVRAAAAIELVHVASLIHDDVVDAAPTRRGRPSVNRQFGDDVAILMADLLYSHAFDLALSAMDPEVARVLSRTTRCMCESEIFQIEKREAVLTREEYYYIIESKTAALFSACAELGGVLAGASDAARNALKRFGRLVGMAYQITDDALDYEATDTRWGKSRGKDLEQKKQTLPIVYAFEQASAADREALLSELRNGHRIEIVLPLLERYGGLDYSWQTARNLAREAQELVPLFEADSQDPSFHALCDFVITRSY